MKAAGVHIYVDGREQKLKVLFDQCIWPIGPNEPFRIGAGRWAPLSPAPSPMCVSTSGR